MVVVGGGDGGGSDGSVGIDGGGMGTALSLDPRSDRSCTSPRAPTPKTRQPDPDPAPGPAGGWPPPGPPTGAPQRGHPRAEGPVEATAVTPRGDSGAGGANTDPPPLRPPSFAPPSPPPFWCDPP